MKIVVNHCFGGFRLSEKAEKMLPHVSYYYDEYEHRTDEDLVKVVETLGKEADGSCADLDVVIIPDNATDWEINDYDGAETVIYVVDGKIRHR